MMVTEVLVQIGALMAPFLAIDKIIKPEHRAVISKYLFADLHASFQGFESAVIGGLMSPFMRDDRLVWQRVFVFSVVVCWIWGFLFIWAFRATFIANDYSLTEVLENGASPIFVLTVAPVVGAIFSFPSDVASLEITRKLFIQRQPRFPWTLIYYLLDVFSSAVVSVFLMIVMVIVTQVTQANLAKEDLEGPLLTGFMFAFLANASASLLVSALQLVSIVFGILLRVFMRALYPLRWIAKHTAAQDHPFSTIGLAFALSIVSFEYFFVIT